MADRTGQKLGNYRLLRVLGKGAFAEVYLGEHLYLETQAAIKVLHTQLAQTDIEQFRFEARTIARLEHPHIVRVFDFGVEATTPFLVMSYAPGGTLRMRHPRGSRLPLATVVDYVQQIAPALQYAHEQKLIHRDIKPENLLLGRNNEILLSDFGIALVEQSSLREHTYEMAGTISYMAPEQIQARPRPASDQYALGIIVYEWLSGNPPFTGSFTEIAAKQSLTPPPSLREKVPWLPETVEQVVMIALAKDPAHRFASIQAFAHALRQASQQELQGSPTAGTTSDQRPPAVKSTPSTNQIISSSMPTFTAEPYRATTGDRQGTDLFTPPPGGPIAAHVTSSTQAQQRKQGLSRRTILFSLVGVATVGVVGTSVALLVHPPSPKPPPPSPTPPGPITLGSSLFTYHGHSDSVWTLAWSPDSKRIASGSFDNTVQVWDATAGNHAYTYRGHSTILKTVAWSPDGQYIASGSQDMTAQVWKANNGSHIYTYLKHYNYVNGITWSPDSKRIASGGGDETVQVWDATTGENVYIYRGHSSYLTNVAWSPGGRRIATGSGDSTVQVWNASDGGNVRVYRGHTKATNGVAWSKNNKHIASGGFDNTVQVWNPIDGSHIFTYRGHKDYISELAWSPDNTRIASSSQDGTVHVWNATDGSDVYIYVGHGAKPVYTVAWSPDGKLLASGGGDFTVQVWQIP